MHQLLQYFYRPKTDFHNLFFLSFAEISKFTLQNCFSIFNFYVVVVPKLFVKTPHRRNVVSDSDQIESIVLLNSWLFDYTINATVCGKCPAEMWLI